MKKRYYIKGQVSGRKLPISLFVCSWLLMDKFKAPEWLIGIYWFLAVLVVLTYIYDLSHTEEIGVDIQNILSKEQEKTEKEEMVEKAFFKKPQPSVKSN